MENPEKNTSELLYFTPLFKQHFFQQHLILFSLC